MIKIWKKRNAKKHRADRTALIDVIQAIARDRANWRKLALKRLHIIKSKDSKIEELEARIEELEDESKEQLEEIVRLKEFDDSNLVVLFDWNNLTYHQKERVKAMADVMKGYTTYEQFARHYLR